LPGLDGIGGECFFYGYTLDTYVSSIGSKLSNKNSRDYSYTAVRVEITSVDKLYKSLWEHKSKYEKVFGSTRVVLKHLNLPVDVVYWGGLILG